VEALEKKIQQQLEPYRRQYELTMTIPGIRQTAAANILAEIGPFLEQFPEADYLCSWAGICSGNNRSAGKSKSSHIKKANKFLLAAAQRQLRQQEPRPVARGLLGFRIRTAPRPTYSVVKDPSGITLSPPPAKIPRKPKTTASLRHVLPPLNSNSRGKELDYGDSMACD
jgi:hypothetical protein